MTRVINAVRRDRNLVDLNYGFSKTREEGSGCEVYYGKNLQILTAVGFVSQFLEENVGDAFVHIFGGQYNNRVDVDFHFVACHERMIDGMAVAELVRFDFWLVSSAADPSKLVLHVRSPMDTRMNYALGALLTIATKGPGVSLISSKRADFKRHIEQVFLEFETRASPYNEEYENVDYNLSDGAELLTAVVLPELNATLGVNVKAFNLYGNSIQMDFYRQDMKIRNLVGQAFTFTAEKLVNPPFRIAIELPSSGTWLRQLRKAFIWILKNL